MSERPRLVMESPARRVNLPHLRGSLRWLSFGGLLLMSVGAGYLGAEINRSVNQPVAEPTTTSSLVLPGYPGEGQVALDIWDRYVMTNDRLNKVAVFNDIVDKDQDRRIKELQEHTGIHIPKPTPRPRATVSERLRPGPTATPTATP